MVRHLPEPVGPAARRAEVARYGVRENIQWHIPPGSSEDHFSRGYGLDLVIRFFEPYDPKARKYSSHKLSAFAVDVMLDATGLAFRPGMRDYLVDFIAWAIRTNSGTLDTTTTTSFREFIDVDGLGFSQAF